MTDLDIIERALLLGAPRYGHTEALEALARLKAKATNRVFTDSEVRAMFMALRQNEFFEDSGTMLMHVDDFDERVASFFSDPA